MPARVTLTVVLGPLLGRQYPFTERTTGIIGRAEDCWLRLPDDAAHRKVSRYHCLLDVNPPDVRLRDLGSLNGTFVNGVKIGHRPQGTAPVPVAATDTAEHNLAHGDQFTVGGTMFRVDISVPAVCEACSTEVPAEQTEESRIAPTRFLCPDCRHPLPPPRDLGQPRCAACGRILEDYGGRPGDVLCGACRESPNAVLLGLLRHANAGDRNLTAIEGYQLVRELGHGGMGAVFLARRQPDGDEVALKIMLPRVAVDPRSRAMFLREMDINRALEHPHVVELRDAGCSHGIFFFTLEYCNGGSVLQLVRSRGGTLAVSEAVPIILQALDGLEYAHNVELPAREPGGEGHRGLVHRDLTLDNLLLHGHGQDRVVKISDYGLSKAFDAAGLSGHTWTGAVGGKPHYVCRQQVINYKYARPEVDVWSLAACLYAMLTGCPPRDFPVDQDCWQAVLQCDPVPIRQRLPNVPPRLAALLDAALLDRDELCFKSAAAFKRELEATDT